MKRLSTGFLTLSLALALVTGCSRESNKGGPTGDKKAGTTGTTGTTTTGTGTTGTTTTTTTTNGAREDFTIKVPTGYTNVTQGEKQSVTVTINRNGKFEDEVNLKFDAPEGIKVEPATAKVAKGANDTQVTVHANPDAKLGTSDVTVTGTTPAGGNPATVKLGVEVKKK